MIRDDIEAARELVWEQFPNLDFSYQERYIDPDSNTDTASSSTSSTDEDEEEEEEDEEEEEHYKNKRRNGGRRARSKPDLVSLDIFNKQDTLEPRTTRDLTPLREKHVTVNDRATGPQRHGRATGYVDIPEDSPSMDDSAV